MTGRGWRRPPRGSPGGTWARGVARAWEKNWPDAAGLLLRRFPHFVFDSDPASLAGEVPVFTFHVVERARLGRQLAFLAANGYRTLTADELFAVLRGRAPLEPRSAVLSFDDAHRSLYEVAFPLLSAHGQRAVAFVAPAWIRAAAEAPPEDDAFCRYPLCTWEQLREMHASGLVDVQSHTLHHNRIAVSPRVLDFVRPDDETHVFADPPLPTFRTGEGGERLPRPGEPVYASAPAMRARARYLDDPRVRARCAALVRDEGGARFFERPDWRPRLARELTSAAPAAWGGFESAAEHRAALRRDLAESRDRLEERLPGLRVRHLCYPWNAAGGAAVAASRATGYLSNFWGTRLDRRANRPGGDPFRIVRLSEDWLLSLPGEGRLTLRDALRERAARLRPFRARAARGDDAGGHHEAGGGQERGTGPEAAPGGR